MELYLILFNILPYVYIKIYTKDTIPVVTKTSTLCANLSGAIELSNLSSPRVMCFIMKNLSLLIPIYFGNISLQANTSTRFAK